MPKLNKNLDEEKSFPKVRLNWYPGHMAKTRKEMMDDLKMIDIVIEILDARIPISSRNPDIEDLIKNKKKIIILNKKDLADDEITSKWVEFFKEQNIMAIPFEANKKNDTSRVTNAIKSECSDILNKYAIKGRSGYKIKAMIFGTPNVGKSTFINCVAKKNKMKAENRPGVTKEKQWLEISDNIVLMDTPGMLWPKFQNDEVKMHLAFTNSIGENAIDNEEIAFLLLKFLIENYKTKLEKRYDIKIETFSNDNEYTIEIRDQIALKKGCIMSGGKIDETKVSNMILNDFRSGKLGKISLEKPLNS